MSKLKFNSDSKHSIASRLALMLITLTTVLLNSHYLGKEGLGSIALLQFGLLLVTGMAGFVAAGYDMLRQCEINAGARTVRLG